MRSALVTLLIIAVAAYGTLLAALWLGQRALLYKPDRAHPAPPADPPAGFRTLESRTADGLALAHWFVPPRDPSAPVVLVLHGNAGHRGSAFDKFRPLADWGHGLVVADYRGYGGNPGKPSEPGLLADARSVLEALADQGVPAERVVLYGESLGTGVAVAMAAERPVAGLILEAPFSSVADVAQSIYWYTPAKWLVRDRFDSALRMRRVSAPILVLHGGRDETIPPRFGRRLHAAAPEPKHLWFHDEANHIDLWERGADRVVADFLRRRSTATAGDAHSRAR